MRRPWGLQWRAERERETTARRIRARHQPRLRRKLQSSSGSPAAIAALLAVHGVGEAVGSGVERRGGVVSANCSSGRAAFIGGGRLTVDTAQGRCNGRTGVSVGLARGRLRCWATERQGGWRGGERHELDGGGRPREHFGGGWHARAARLRRIWVLAG